MKAWELLYRAFARPAPPDPGYLAELTREALSVLRGEREELRPRASDGSPGGLVRLDRSTATIILPDLHARRGFLLSLAAARMPGGGTTLDALEAGAVQVLCLGDGFHAEARALERWREAYAEWSGGYARREAMDAEMAESLGLMEMVMLFKISFPERFHFLKGNHENVLNEEGGGNHSFRKFVLEGDMVADYMRAFYGEEITSLYAGFEKSLPLFAVGGRFLASHAEPARAYGEDELINAPLLPEVIEGLTWTDNGAARPGAVRELLARLLPDVERPRFVSGHRTIPSLYRERSEGYHLQIHNPNRYVVAWAMPDRDLDPKLDVGEIRAAGPAPARD